MMSTYTKHKVATDALENLGTFPIPDNSGRDAIHLAVEPVVAGSRLKAGERIKVEDGKAVPAEDDEAIGIVDPFVDGVIRPGQRFWLVVLPRTITSLRHVWSHPLFPEEPASAYHADADDHYVADAKSVSEKWMREWAVKHVGYDYYGDGNISEESAYAFAIGAGENVHIGPYESAREYIDSEWWDHWETLTGKRGKRGDYFSCSC